MSLGLLVTQARNELVRRVIAVDPPKHFGRPRCLTIAQTLDKIMYILENADQFRAVHGQFHIDDVRKTIARDPSFYSRHRRTSDRELLSFSIVNLVFRLN